MKQIEYEDITLFDFEKLCRSRGVRNYTYLTREQETDSAAHTVTLRFTGKVMDIQYQPNQIVFSGESGELRFVRVKYVRVYHTSPGKHLLYGIICGIQTQKSSNTEYRMTAV